MQATISDFVRVLRGIGLPISVAEVIDAHEAARSVGLSQRTLLKSALGSTLAKTAEERELFDGCFERFFTFQTLQEEDGDEAARKADGKSPQPPAAAGTAEAPSAAGAESPLARRLMDDDWTTLDAEIAAAGQREGANRVASFLQRARFTRSIAEALGVRDMDDEIARLEAGGPDQRDTAVELERRRQLVHERIRDYVDRQIALFATPMEAHQRLERLPYIRLSHIEQRHYEDMQHLVRRMAKRLMAAHARRAKRARRGQLDVRRTLRSGLAYDGVPFNPRWRQRRRERPRIMAVCDVSGSVAATARFLLMFLYSVNAVLPRTRAFAFSSELHEVTDLFDRHPLEEAVATAVELYGNQPTNYGRALADFQAACLDAVDHRTTVVVLGDARSNYGDPGLDSLRAVYQRARQVIWLNPEPRVLWGYGDSEMPRLATACHRVRTCNTLKDLERLVEDLLRTAV